MLKKLFPVIIMALSLAACKSKSAFNYSQEFVKKEQSLTNDIRTTEDNVKTFFNNQQFDSIAAAGARMEKLVDAKLAEIKSQPAPDAKEAESFKSACIRYFEFIKSVYTSYKEYGNAATPEQRETILTRIKEIADKRSVEISNVQSAQKKFADANGFKIEK